MLAYTYPVLVFLWTMLEIFLFVIWIWLCITVFIDIFRSHDLGGVAKAIWVLFIVILPFLGVLIYLIARGGGMHDRAVEQAEKVKVVAPRGLGGIGASTDVEAGGLRHLRRQHEGVADLVHVGAGHFPGNLAARGERQRRGSDDYAQER